MKHERVVINANAKLWLLAVPVFATLLLWPRSFPLDDAYITLHNARALLGGGDPLYGVHPLVGATSAVHLVSVAFFGLIMPLPDALIATAVAATVLYAWGLWRLHPHWVFVFIGLTASFVPVWLLNGLETSMAMAAVVWAFVLADHRRLPLLLGLMPFIRPDLIFLAAPLALRQVRHEPVRVIGLGLLTSLPFAAWTYLATGVPYPTTAAAKIWFFAGYADPFGQRVTETLTAAAMSFIPVLLGGLVGLFSKPAGWCGFIYVAALFATAIIFFPGSLAHNDYRYLAALVPILCYGLTVLPRRAIYAIAAISALTGTNALVRLRQLHKAMALWTVGADAVARLPEGATVIVHDAGLVAWRRPDVHLIDMIGLKTPSSIETMKKHNVRPCLWGSAISEIAERSGAGYIVILESPYFSCIAPNLREQGWRVSPVSQTRLRIYRLER